MAISAADVKALMKKAGMPANVVDALKADQPLHQQGLDSVDLPIVAAGVEQQFKVDLSDVASSKLRTLDDFVSLVNSRVR